MREGEEEGEKTRERGRRGGEVEVAAPDDRMGREWRKEEREGRKEEEDEECEYEETMERGLWEWRETEMAKDEKSGEGWKLTVTKGEMEEEWTPMATPEWPEGEGRENQEK
jgi:hypothetical protein